MSAVPLIVLGSASRDYTVVVERHPLPGETLLGGDVALGPGGKGANQAAAAARAGARPVFLGAVGKDATGDEILAELSAGGVDVSHMLSVEGVPTGVALITVARDGENSIVVGVGANAQVLAEPTSDLLTELAGTRTVVLAQLEIPFETVEAAAATVDRLGARFALNVSPSQPIPASLLALCDPVIVNESEAGDLVGRRVESTDDALEVAREILATAPSVVITLGGSGVVFGDASGVSHLPSRKVTVVDTTGAGDAFAGALAAALSEGNSLTAAVEAGIDAGALAVQHLGAQPPRD